MDWRNNAWVGIGAAGVLVVFIIVIIWYATSSGPSAVEGAVGLTFECEACSGHFTVATSELEDYDVYSVYMNMYETAAPCRLCGEEVAYWVYYCPVCEQWYRYKRSRARMMTQITCPEGHIIPEENL